MPHIEITGEMMRRTKSGAMHVKLISDGWEYHEEGDGYFYTHQDFEKPIKFSINQAHAITTAFKFRSSKNDK